MALGGRLLTEAFLEEGPGADRPEGHGRRIRPQRRPGGGDPRELDPELAREEGLGGGGHDRGPSRLRLRLVAHPVVVGLGLRLRLRRGGDLGEGGLGLGRRRGGR